MLCSPPPATTLASSCAGSEGFCAPCCRRSSQRSRIHNRPKTGRTLLLHERLLKLSTTEASSSMSRLSRSSRRCRPAVGLIEGGRRHGRKIDEEQPRDRRARAL